MAKKRKIIEVIEGYVVPRKLIARKGQIFGYDLQAWTIDHLYTKEVGQYTRKIRVTIQEL